MSPVVPDAGGSVFISKVQPQHDGRSGPDGCSYDASANIPKPLVRFYRGEPEVLGTTQIFSGILLLTFGIPLIIINAQENYSLAITSFCGVPIWSGVLFIISGSLSFSASLKPTLGKVTASLVMNIFSSLAAVCGLILALIEISLSEILGTEFKSLTYCAYSNNDPQCLGAFTPWPAEGGLLSYFILLLLLMFCISISTSVFACKTVCRTSLHEMSVVVYQTTTWNAADTTRDAPICLT
ncbi:membrane-spanning 4-domains subfamily A member 4A-like [Eleutherodactylus coqui]|uniref:Uncharacterized protein n=1 Tax=Eleutherodactylus coqui TaxID=57060 RepID=A0A8J6E889_ELECQ|nr:hypothetical protein GDO78_016165 [Eleutherodactylus coqui]KAG9466763.1 hypothetical protein GDO78_016165 [Eleutherodactylus coqui]KAG9466764.1 hypothetical protein GDO78_016165 [Eleutherodactylus coqui]KAG9466765.1 hypothetical protein GDO78_016165 [Eleutherodactylus coqui]